MAEKDIFPSVRIELPGKASVDVSNTRQALDLLSDPDWPDRGTTHREAVETLLKVEDGHRSAVDARDALVRAAQDAGALAEASGGA